jgi:hypothetical protein
MVDRTAQIVQVAAVVVALGEGAAQVAQPPG